MSFTNTTSGARDHARAQAGTLAEAMPTLPASSHPDPPPGVSPGALSWAETVAGGGYTSKVLARGTTLRLTDRDGDGCAHVLLYNADQPWERLCVADTVKIPWQAYLGSAHPLLSDQGRVLATIVGDYANGAHDALCGCSSRAANEARYGDGSVHGPIRPAVSCCAWPPPSTASAPGTWPPAWASSSGVRVGDDGELEYTGSHYPGGYVELRAELPLVVLIANAPHPLDPRAAYTCTPLEVLAWHGTATVPADPLWSFTPELERAYLNTADYAYARGLDG